MVLLTLPLQRLATFVQSRLMHRQTSSCASSRTDMAKKKISQEDHDVMMACWRGGERGTAIAIAKRNEVDEKDMPDGMMDHIRAMMGA